MPKVQLTIPAVAPVMVLQLVLFPHSLTPLYIFEPRYRAMLQWALEHDRVFCIALQKPGIQEEPSGRHFYHTAGLGLIRACVGQDDGTSHLMLQGMLRVKFTGFKSTDPFFLAKIDPLQSTGVPTDETSAEFFQLQTLLDKARLLCEEIRDRDVTSPGVISTESVDANDPDFLADYFANTFLRDPLQRQEVLNEEDVGERLTVLARHLRNELDTLL